MDLLLHLYVYLIPILQTFAREYRVGDIAPSHKLLRSCTVEDSVRLIGKALSTIGDTHHRLTQQGNIDIHLYLQDRAYSMEGTPPKRVKPIPIQVLSHITGILAAANYSYM